MRRRVLERLIKRLRELQEQELTRDQALMKLGAAKEEAVRQAASVETKARPTHPMFQTRIGAILR